MESAEHAEQTTWSSSAIFPRRKRRGGKGIGEGGSERQAGWQAHELSLSLSLSVSLSVSLPYSNKYRCFHPSISFNTICNRAPDLSASPAVVTPANKVKLCGTNLAHARTVVRDLNSEACMQAHGEEGGKEEGRGRR